MKMKANHFITAFLSISLSSCEKFVEVNPPQDQVISRKVFDLDETATSAIVGLYTEMMTVAFRSPHYISLYTGMYSDELDYVLTVTGDLDVYRNSLAGKDAVTHRIWSGAYKSIFHSNSIIEGIESSDKLSIAVKNQVLGEALFIRAFWYFYLCNLYGDVPLITETDYNTTGRKSRSKIDLVYDQVIADLLKAKLLMSEFYVASNSVSPSVNRTRPNKHVASALLARVYLYIKKWDLAEVEASQLIENSQYAIEEINTAFKSDSKEAIWQLEMPTPVLYPTYEANYFILTSRPTGVRGTEISKTLLEQFDSSDLRKKNWMGLTPNQIHYYPYKYKTRNIPIDEHSVCIRLAEMFLIRSEAKAEQNDITGAIGDLNRIRIRAGLIPIEVTDPTIDRSTILPLIFDERRKELFCEWGHRWFDIKRSGKSDEIMNQLSVRKGGVWQDFKSVWPIPLTDIQNNNQLQQTPGYND